MSFKVAVYRSFTEVNPHRDQNCYAKRRAEHFQFFHYKAVVTIVTAELPFAVISFGQGRGCFNVIMEWTENGPCSRSSYIGPGR